MTNQEPLSPSNGLNVLHLFCHPDGAVDASAVKRAVEEAKEVGMQVVTAAIMGAKADTCFMVLGTNLWDLESSSQKFKRLGSWSPRATFL